MVPRAHRDWMLVFVEAKNVHGLVTKLVEIVPEYWPSPEIISLGAVDRHDQALSHRLARETLTSTQESAA